MIRSKQVQSSVSLLCTFLYDLFTASLGVARIILEGRGRHQPAIVAVPIEVRTDWGIALLAYVLSATPGSTCLHVADDRRTIYVHFLDVPDTKARAAGAKARYERLILDIEGPGTRP